MNILNIILIVLIAVSIVLDLVTRYLRKKAEKKLTEHVCCWHVPSEVSYYKQRGSLVAMKVACCRCKRVELWHCRDWKKVSENNWKFRAFAADGKELGWKDYTCLE